MATKKKRLCLGFGFCPEQSSHHFLVTIPAGNRKDVLISEHFSYDIEHGPISPTLAVGEAEGKLRVAPAGKP